MEEQTSIRYIFVRPRNRLYCSYYINMNMKDQHSMKYEDIYRFIASRIKPPATIQAFEQLRTFQPFFIDVNKNEITKLDFKSEIKKREKIVYRHVEQKAAEEKENRSNTDTGLRRQVGRLTDLVLKDKIPTLRIDRD